MRQRNHIKAYFYKMIFNVSSTLSYDVFSKTTFIFNIQALQSDSQLIMEESLVISPEMAFEEFTLNNSDTRFIKMEVPEDVSFKIRYRAKVAVNPIQIEENELLKTSSLINLDHEVLPFLAPSRHCESDKLTEFALATFGNLLNDYSKARAINDWIFTNIKYTISSTNASTSATDTLQNKSGVCKDFAHLGIALCRALDIPARYFTGYAAALNPPDFHACYEVYINGHWNIFDPTNLANTDALVKIANAKDASEVPVLSFFGEINCTYMEVECHPILSDSELFD